MCYIYLYDNIDVSGNTALSSMIGTHRVSVGAKISSFISAITSYALHELIKAIYVDAPDKSSGKRRQHIHIQYDGLGFIPLNELLAQEKA